MKTYTLPFIVAVSCIIGIIGAKRGSKLKGSISKRRSVSAGTYCDVTIEGVLCSTDSECSAGQECSTRRSDGYWIALGDDESCDLRCKCYCLGTVAPVNILTDDTSTGNDDPETTASLTTDDDNSANTDDTVTSKKGNKNSQKGDDDESPKKKNTNSKNRDDNGDTKDDNDERDSGNNVDSANEDSNDIYTTDSADSADLYTTDSADITEATDDSNESLDVALNASLKYSKKAQREVKMLMESIWILVLCIVTVNIIAVWVWCCIKRKKRERKFGSHIYVTTDQDSVEEQVIDVGSE